MILAGIILKWFLIAYLLLRSDSLGTRVAWLERQRQNDFNNFYGGFEGAGRRFCKVETSNDDVANRVRVLEQRLKGNHIDPSYEVFLRETHAELDALKAHCEKQLGGEA